MTLDWATIATIIVGNGAVVAIITLVFTLHQNKVQRNFEGRQNELRQQFEARQDNLRRDFEARREAKDYYRPLYGHVAMLHELAIGYFRSLDKRKIRVFDFDNLTYIELTSDKILLAFNQAYNNFSKFYIKKKSEGYELFISESLKKSLMNFWCEAQSFNEDSELMKKSERIAQFTEFAEDATNTMEELFGLDFCKGD